MTSGVAITLLIVQCGCTATRPAADYSNAVSAAAAECPVSKEVSREMQCADCEGFRRVELPPDYVLPTDDLGSCLKYVLCKSPDTANLLISGWMSCIEAAPDSE